MAAFETGHFQRDQIGMARRKLGRPYFVVGAGGVAVLPDGCCLARTERLRAWG
jgi:hypothetical protein